VGSLVGNAKNAVIISASGQQKLSAGATSDEAIGSITVKHDVSYAEILAGYSTDATAANHRGTAVNADAQITGTVEITGDFTGSSIVAGVATGGDGTFGNATDTKISSIGDRSLIVSKIASVIIHGNVTGGSDANYGIVAQQVASVNISNTAINLQSGASNDTTPIPIGGTNVSILEVAP